MKRWQKYFSKTILDRGRNYYRNQRVRNLQKMGNMYTAIVMGTEAYKVVIHMDGDDIVEAECDCPYADDGFYCKHMAAVLYAIEEKYGMTSSTENEVQVHPFADRENDTEGYRYFDIAKMTSALTFRHSVCEEAKKLIADNTIRLIRVEFGYEQRYDSCKQIGIARGAVKCQGKNEAEVILQFDKDCISMARCHKPSCYHTYDVGYVWGNKGLCVHETALLFLLADYIEKYNPGDNTDLNASRLINAYQKRFFVQENGNEIQKNVKLNPRVEEGYEGLKLSFQIGEGKLYVVKNLTELVGYVEGKKAMPLGKTAEIDFAKNDFDEKSREYYEYIRKNVREEKKREVAFRSDYRYMTPDMQIKGSMDLYGERLDEFYELTEELPLCFINKTGAKRTTSTISLRDIELDVQLNIQKETDENEIFQGITAVVNLPEMVEGNRYSYYLDDAYFNRVSREQIQEIQPFIELGNVGNIEFHVGRQHLADFYYNVLPMLEKKIEVIHNENEMEEIQSYLPPEVTFRFYLDMEEDDITCKAEAVYGEKIFSVMDLCNDEIKDKCRDLMRETKVLNSLAEYFPTIDRENKVFRCDGEEEFIFRVLESGIDMLLEIGEVHSTDRFRNLSIRRKPKVAVGVSVESDIMNLSISSEGISKEELYEVLKSYRKKKKYHRLKNGDFLSVENEEIEMLNQLVDAMHISAKDFTKEQIQIPTYRALYLDKILEQNSGVYTNRDKYFKKIVKEFKTINDSDFEMPESLQNILRKYQEVGYKWLRMLYAYGFGGILADDMGLGKTLQVISMLLALKEEGEKGTSLIVAPASLVYNWKEEFAKFAPALKSQLIVEAKEERVKLLAQYQDYDVIITSYDLLKRDIAEYEDKKFTIQVIDEAQYIKNHTTSAAKAVKVIQSKVRFALTGTPIENRLSELWSIFDYLMPGYLYTYETFRREMETPITKNKDENAAQRLRNMISPFILRRLKENVLQDLPEKMEEVRVVKFDSEQQKLYDGQVVHIRQLLEKGSEDDFNKNKLQVLAELTRIRQICCDPTLLFENYSGGSAKRDLCLDLVRGAIEGEHKILIFSQFTTMLELLEHDLTKEGIAYYKITGDTPKAKRLQYVKEFNENKVPVFLISLKAGGTGLNLTGADIVIHYDPWWNLAVQNQATDRAHRIGQTKKVSVYKLIAKDSIEEKIVKMQETKKNLANEILSGEMGGIAALSKEELLELIK